MVEKVATKRNSWIAAKEKPNTYELVTIKYVAGVTQCAWWTGSSWDSGKKLRRSIIEECICFY